MADRQDTWTKLGVCWKIQKEKSFVLGTGQLDFPLDITLPRGSRIAINHRRPQEKDKEGVNYPSYELYLLTEKDNRNGSNQGTAPPPPDGPPPGFNDNWE